MGRTQTDASDSNVKHAHSDRSTDRKPHLMGCLFREITPDVLGTADFPKKVK